MSPRKIAACFFLSGVFLLSSLPATCAQPIPKTPPGHLLEKDKRLESIIPGSPEMLAENAKQIRVGLMLGWIEKCTNVHLNAEFENIDQQNVFAVFDKVKASDLMDSIAALWLVPWEKDSPKSYQLIRPLRDMAIFAPVDDYDRKISVAELAFMEGINAAADNSTVQELAAGKTVDLSDLPHALQRNFNDILTAMSELAVGRFHSPQPEHGDYNGATLQIASSTSVKGVSEWQLNINVPNRGSQHMMMTDYERFKRKYTAQENATVYTPIKYEITQGNAHKLPELRHAVHLELTNITGEEVLQTMHKRYGINIIADAPLFLRSRTNVTVNAETLADAFDELVRTFPGAIWEYRPSGFFLLRGPNNPVQRTGD